MLTARRLAATNRCILAVCWCALLVAAPVAAEICKYIDGDGNMHYTNVPPEKGWKKLSCGVGDEGGRSSDRTTRSPTPAGFPRVDADTQKGRDDMRRKVLADELATEEKLLIESRAAYGDGAPTPLPDEMSSAQKYADRLGKLRQAVSLHEKNVEALRKEIAALR
ncbi:MAG: DUF4124 domain-containing protein [Casimicrobiaceae bacterium]